MTTALQDEVEASSVSASSNGLDGLLDQLDVADASVRSLYCKLADDPDLATECETTLRELHGKRNDLARRVGLAALDQRRQGRPSAEAVCQPEALSVGASAPAEVEAEPRAPMLDVPETDEEPSPSIPEEPSTSSHAEAPPPSTDQVRPETTAVPVSQQQLQEFLAAAKAPSPNPRTPPRPDDRTFLLGLATHVKIAEGAPSLKVFEREVEQIERAASEDQQRRWREMTREGQVRWLSLLVAWAKALDQEALQFKEATLGVAGVFRRLREFSLHDAPGFVHGFARNASPRSGSWRSDALRLLREIRPLPEPVEAKAPGQARAPVVEEDEPTPEVLADWPLLDRVKGLRVVLLGGEPREERRVALEQAFQFESLEWIPRNRPRLVASLAERAAQGTVDFVLVTKFVAHKETEAIQRANGAPMLTMRHGYGVTAIRLVFEEHFARRAELG